MSTRGGPMWALATSSRRRPLQPVPLTRTSSTTTDRSGMMKPNSLMYLSAGPRERSGPGGPASGRPTRAPRPRACVPLHERCPEVAGAGRAGSGRVLVGRHHQGTVRALVAQVQEALGADLGAAGVHRRDCHPGTPGGRLSHLLQPHGPSPLSIAPRGPGTIGEVTASRVTGMPPGLHLGKPWARRASMHCSSSRLSLWSSCMKVSGT